MANLARKSDFAQDPRPPISTLTDNTSRHRSAHPADIARLHKLPGKRGAIVGDLECGPVSHLEAAKLVEMSAYFMVA